MLPKNDRPPKTTENNKNRAVTEFNDQDIYNQNDFLINQPRIAKNITKNTENIF